MRASIATVTARRLFAGLALVCFANFGPAQTSRIDPAGIDGSLVLCGSYKASPEMFDAFVELAGGAKAKIVIVTFDKAKYGGPPRDALTDAAKKRDAAEPVVIDYEDARNAIPETTGLWLHVDSVSPMARVLKEPRLPEVCKKILQKGGVIGSAAAGVRYVASKELAINGAPCMKLLPDSMIDLLPKGKTSRLPKSVNSWKGLIAYEIEPDAAMIVKGRTVSALAAGEDGQ